MIKIFNKKFRRIQNILYHHNFHIFYNSSYLNNNINNLLSYDLQRFRLANNYNELFSPKFLFVSLCLKKFHIVKFSIYHHSNRYKWNFHNNFISNIHSELFLSISNNKLIVSNIPDSWDITNGYIKHIKSNQYITCDLSYNIYFTTNLKHAIQFDFHNNSIHYIKPTLKVDFEYNNLLHLIPLTSLNSWNHFHPNKSNNFGILLAAGSGSRFNHNIPKQLFVFNNKPIITYSLDILTKTLDKIIVVTHTNYLFHIKNIVDTHPLSHKIHIITNDFNCRLKSIEVGLDYIYHSYYNILNIIIHDSARPFIKKNHIETLLFSNNTYLYSQFCLKLLNGLLQNNSIIPNRDDFLELCTPLCINFDLCYFIFKNYISSTNRITYEFIPILHLLKLDYNLIYGEKQELQKITTPPDLYQFEDIGNRA